MLNIRLALLVLSLLTLLVSFIPRLEMPWQIPVLLLILAVLLP